jgi:guanidinoacetate N-methyltransferase
MRPSEIPTFDDIRDLTVRTRAAIGFEERDTWRDASATFTDHTLTIQGHPVMEDWEEGYMARLADICGERGGTVLEIGFGMGISARYLQSYPIDRHIIIEANWDVFERLAAFAVSATRPVSPLFGFWEDTTALLPDASVSGILFDTYPLTEKEIHGNHFPFFKEAHRLLAPGGVLTYYSDEIDRFSPLHRALLEEAGFSDIRGETFPVTPPSDCSYWKSGTILAPRIRRS